MHTISIINKKGGTGKTTTTVNLGVALRQLGQRVLLIDFDPQGSLTFNMGIYQVGYDISNALIGEIPLEKAIVRKEGLDIIPAGPDLGQVELAFGTFYRREEVLRSLLEEVRGYDYVLIDCSPGGYLLQRNALSASDWVLAPMQVETLNVKGLMQLEKEVELVIRDLNPKLQMLGVLPIAFNRTKGIFGKSNRFQIDLYAHMQKALKVNFMDTEIRRHPQLQQSSAKGKSVHLFAPKSQAAEDYTSLANEVLTKTRRRVAQAV